MFKINSTSLIVILASIFLINANLDAYGQARKIDAALVVLTPKAGDTIISRIKGTYLSKFIIKNNGPDIIKIGDTYSFDITFGNVQYGYFFSYPYRNILSGEQDTIEVLLKMIWDTDNNTTFCGTLYLAGYKADSIEKESKTEMINNKFCQSVYHDSRLQIFPINIGNITIYPNPTLNKFNVKIEKPAKNISIEVIDILGNLIKTVDTKPYKSIYEIDLYNTNSLANGLVIVKVRNGNYVCNKKVFISEGRSNQ